MALSAKSRALLLTVLVATVLTCWWYYQLLSRPPQPSPAAIELRVPSGSSIGELGQLLSEKKLVEDTLELRQMVDQLGLSTAQLRGGRFFVEPNWSLKDILKHLWYGKQVPMQFILHDLRETKDVAGFAARNLEPDSLNLWAYFQDTTMLKELGLSAPELMSLFIPNTYELYWNTSSEDFIRRMQREHQRFWNRKRRTQAASLDLSTVEVYTLASILERETLQDVEKSRMAGLYYNRLQRNMRLQADPTAVFASRDFHTHRVTNRHLRVDSPYNTYRYKGLPPGPITMASIASIDAVLNLEQHELLFFCARGDGSGLHNFAVTLEEHKANAALYRKNKKRRQ